MIYLIYILTFVSLYLAVTWLNFLYVSDFPDKKKLKRFPTVTIAVPAYNEASTIIKSITSILNLNYPHDKLEIIVINDYSTDNTKEVVENMIKKNNQFNIKLINKKNNQGKAYALNSALEVASGEIFGCVDADSFVSKDSLRLLIPHLFNQKTAAVISSIKVVNQKNILGKVQRMEYFMVTLTRTIMSLIDTLYTTPGVLSVYKTRVLKELGGFDTNCLTEDFEIAMRLRYNHYNVKMEPESITYTKVPENPKLFWRQRIRWTRGFIENNVKYKKMYFNSKYGLLGWFQLPLSVVAPTLLIVGMLFIGYNMFKTLYEFIIRVILIEGYLDSLFIFPSLKRILLSQNFKIGFPLIVASLLGFTLLYLAHKQAKEKIRYPSSILVYYLLLHYVMAAYWISAITQEIFKTKKKW